ncbi:MAG: glycosyltransferase family 4 protein [Candidatus Komeilibacteria bacterium]|nr:glycosyltransferase family 4 protein [Candidatus Komeilibacteria bacterium]
MNTLMISTDLKLFEPNSDVAARMLLYAKQLEHLSIIVFSTSGLKKTFLSDKVTVIPTNSVAPASYVFDAVKLGKKIIAQQKIEVITCQDPFLTGLVGWQLKKNLSVGLNIQLHGDFFSSSYYWRKGLSGFIRWLMAKKVLKAADSVRVVSQRIADSLIKKGIASEKIIVAPIYVDAQKFSQEPITVDLHQEFPGKFVILFVGRLVKEKNLNLLIESVNHLVKNGQAVSLAIVGQGNQEDALKSEVARLKLEDIVRFYGWREDLGSFYKTADVLAITSYVEGYNRTAIEAMSCGLPVIMADVGLAEEIIKDQVNGLILKRATAQELAEKITLLIKDQNLNQQLSANALTTASSLPGQDEIISKIILSIKNAINI